MTKKDLIKSLNKINHDGDVYIHCSYNNYKVRHIVNTGDAVVLIVGETANEIEQEHGPDVA